MNLHEVTELIFIEAVTEDWECIYINRKLVYENHKVPLPVLFSLMKGRYFGEVKSYVISEENMEKLGSFPNYFDNIPKEFIEN